MACSAGSGRSGPFSGRSSIVTAISRGGGVCARRSKARIPAKRNREAPRTIAEYRLAILAGMQAYWRNVLRLSAPRRPAEDERRVARVEDGDGPVHRLGRARDRNGDARLARRLAERVAPRERPQRWRAKAVADVSSTLYWFATTAGIPPARSAGATPRRKSLRPPRPVSHAFRTTSRRPRPQRRRRRRSVSTHVERPRPSTRRSAPVPSFSSQAPCPTKWRTSTREDVSAGAGPRASRPGGRRERRGRTSRAARRRRGSRRLEPRRDGRRVAWLRDGHEDPERALARRGRLGRDRPEDVAHEDGVVRRGSGAATGPTRAPTACPRSSRART